MEKIYQLKVSLEGIKPPIWRRLLVKETSSLYELHIIIQIAMGWTNSHLHQFVVNGQCYGESDPYDFVERADENRFRLKHIAPAEKIKFLYEYDFGDGWRHPVIVEKIIDADQNTKYPVCIKGKRACPPEDVGGIWGYESFLESINNPNHEDYEDWQTWYDGPFDPEAFNLDEINQHFREVFK